MVNFKYPLEDYCNKIQDCIGLLAGHLNNGALSLVLGAGASSGFGLPNWKTLVENCAQRVFDEFTPKVSYTNQELKEIMDNVKANGNDDYLEIIYDCLYSGVSFDFSLVKKDLLIAITSLFIGNSRGNIKNVLTYNFDSVLEWYLYFNGLKTSVATFENLLFSSGDVDILHIHGFIPFLPSHGERSDEVVFSKKEFEDRQVGDSYWKDLMNEFFRRNVFLSIGVSPESLVDDVCPYLRELLKWHKRHDLRRLYPFGFAFLTRCDSMQQSTLLEAGIIPCVIPIEDIPSSVFSISQTAMNN